MTGTTGDASSGATARVDAELVRRGLARSRKHAAELVAAGLVVADGRAVTKPSVAVPTAAVIDVAGGEFSEFEYASRAGLKLAGALDALSAAEVPLTVEGSWSLDLGASTGGFTDVLLRRGAEHVVAIDVGHDQIVPQLREDPRVTVVEGFNVRDLGPEHLDRVPDVIVADLSFISLVKVLPAVVGVSGPSTQALLLVKPQFEVGRERLGSGGVVRDPALRHDAVRVVARAAEGVGLRVRAVVPSPLPGPHGNREFFVWLTPGESAPVADAVLDAAIAEAVAWDPDPATTQGTDRAGESAPGESAHGETAAAGGPPPTPPAVVVQPDGATS